MKVSFVEFLHPIHEPGTSLGTGSGPSHHSYGTNEKHFPWSKGITITWDPATGFIFLRKGIHVEGISPAAVKRFRFDDERILDFLDETPERAKHKG